VSRNPAPSREKGKGVAIDAQASLAPSCTDTVTAKWSKGAEALQQGAQDGGNCIPILMRQREGKDGGGKGPLISEEKSLTLATSNDQVLAKQMQVRRLTPVECERLQGFPDDYTRIPWKKKPAEDCPDGPRYKALGNSMAVPCMRWIGEQIKRVMR